MDEATRISRLNKLHLQSAVPLPLLQASTICCSPTFIATTRFYLSRHLPQGYSKTFSLPSLLHYMMTQSKKKIKFKDLVLSTSEPCKQEIIDGAKLALRIAFSSHKTRKIELKQNQNGVYELEDQLRQPIEGRVQRDKRNQRPVERFCPSPPRMTQKINTRKKKQSASSTVTARRTRPSRQRQTEPSIPSHEEARNRTANAKRQRDERSQRRSERQHSPIPPFINNSDEPQVERMVLSNNDSIMSEDNGMTYGGEGCINNSSPSVRADIEIARTISQDNGITSGDMEADMNNSSPPLRTGIDVVHPILEDNEMTSGDREAYVNNSPPPVRASIDMTPPVPEDNGITSGGDMEAHANNSSPPVRADIVMAHHMPEDNGMTSRCDKEADMNNSLPPVRAVIDVAHPMLEDNEMTSGGDREAYVNNSTPPIRAMTHPVPEDNGITSGGDREAHANNSSPPVRADILMAHHMPEDNGMTSRCDKEHSSIAGGSRPRRQRKTKFGPSLPSHDLQERRTNVGARGRRSSRQRQRQLDPILDDGPQHPLNVTVAAISAPFINNSDEPQPERVVHNDNNLRSPCTPSLTSNASITHEDDPQHPLNVTVAAVSAPCINTSDEPQLERVVHNDNNLHSPCTPSLTSNASITYGNGPQYSLNVTVAAVSASCINNSDEPQPERVVHNDNNLHNPCTPSLARVSAPCINNSDEPQPERVVPNDNNLHSPCTPSLSSNTSITHEDDGITFGGDMEPNVTDSSLADREPHMNDSPEVHNEANPTSHMVRARIHGIGEVQDIPTIEFDMLPSIDFETFKTLLNTSLALPRNFSSWGYTNALDEFRLINTEESYSRERLLVPSNVIFEAIDQQEYNISLTHFINKLSDDCRAKVVEGIKLVLAESKSNRELAQHEDENGMSYALKTKTRGR